MKESIPRNLVTLSLEHFIFIDISLHCILVTTGSIFVHVQHVICLNSSIFVRFQHISCLSLLGL